MFIMLIIQIVRLITHTISITTIIMILMIAQLTIHIIILMLRGPSRASGSSTPPRPTAGLFTVPLHCYYITILYYTILYYPSLVRRKYLRTSTPTLKYVLYDVIPKRGITYGRRCVHVLRTYSHMHVH